MRTPATPSPFLTVSEVGKALGVKPSRARQLAQAGVIPVAYITEGRRVVPRPAFDEWVARLSAEALAGLRDAKA